MLLSHTDCHLVIIDIQEKLLPAIADSAGVLANAVKLATAARHFGVPITISEQYPKGIGHTVPEVLKAAGPQAAVFEKLEFSCARNAALRERAAQISRAGRRQMILCGIEAHVCVLQSAVGFADQGHGVAIAADAVSSRAPASKDMALARLARSVIMPVTTEMVLFEWLERAGTADFKALLGLIK
jgi:nicotinamidase-related amidase